MFFKILISVIYNLLFYFNILILFVFYTIFRLAEFFSDPFDFSLKKRDKEVVPWGH